MTLLMLRRNIGITLIELMTAAAIFTILFAAILTTLTSSDRGFRLGQNKLTEQQEARRAMNEMAKFLRESNPVWNNNGTNYSVAISDNNRRIDFYQPILNATTGNISSLRHVIFMPDPQDSRQLKKKIGGSLVNVTIASEVENITFGGGCSECAPYNCSSISNDCPAVKIEIKTKRGTGTGGPFNLTSWVTLRNLNVTLPNETEVAAVEE